MKKIIVNNLKENTNSKITTYLSKTFAKLSIGNIRKALKQKDIKVNGIRTSKDVLIKNHDVLEIYISDPVLYGLPEKIDIIYEDEDILIVDKYAGILSENLDENSSEPSVESILRMQEENENLRLCHRLDRNTEGLLILSKTDIGQKEMLDGFKNSYVEKIYEAYVYGIPSKKEAILEDYLFKDSKKSLVYISHTKQKGYSKIITSYKVKKEFQTYSLLHVKIKTGKTHQIRAHLASIGYPIIGDEKYGEKKINNMFKDKFKHQALRAFSYTFTFPKNYKLARLNDIEIQKKS